MSRYIAPSILAGNFANLQKDVEMLNKSEADWIHVDIMDGVFVPNISFGFPVLEAIKKCASKPLSVHLMIVKPERFIKRFKDAGADHLIVHIEACTHLNSVVQNIKKHGMQAGVAINPHSNVIQLQDIIGYIDQVLLMSVNPGFGGQEFIEHTYRKLEQTKDSIEKTGSKALIGIDGGVELSNAPKLIELGADILVAGSSVFKSSDPTKTIAALKAL